MTARRTIVIGDVHGMLTELNALLKAVEFDPERDRLVCTGDLIHKGPDSAAVVAVMRTLGAEIVKGNHEEQQERFRKALAKAGKIKMKNTEELAAIEADLSDEDREYLEAARLFIEVPGGIVVHGGILPDLEALPTDDEIAAMSRGAQKKLERMLRVRFVRGNAEAKVAVEFTVEYDPKMDADQGLTTAQVMELMADAMSAVVVRKNVRAEGEFIALGNEKPGDPFWADVYDGRFGHVYFGHQPYTDAETPVDFPHATGLDLGCVFGGRLCAVILEEGKPTRAVTVEATAKFADALWED
jgi:hypothetical protein